MKITCPICGIEGLLQQRGNSNRIQHYKGYKEGKRIYSYHKMEVNGSKPQEVKTLKLSSKSESWWAEPDSDRRPSARQADVLTRLDDRPTL